MKKRAAKFLKCSFQSYDNVTKNDLYGSSFNVSNKIELAGICGYGAALYCGTGCFIRRESITGMHLKDYKQKPNSYSRIEDKRNVQELIDASKVLVDCSYEQGTLCGRRKIKLGVQWDIAFTSCGLQCPCPLSVMSLFPQFAYSVAFPYSLRKQLGLSETKFDITDKAVSEDTLKRYKQEIYDFGSSSTMFTMIATFALLNLFGFIGGLKRVIMDLDFKSSSQLILQIVVCAVIVMVNKPVYEALFFRNDNGPFPSSVMPKSMILASLACCLAPLF
ncbi:hypothetical protein L6164_030986 [Bauhinia variegata]|uniref:Uncharacterized protein n=1 Tax=Bauhinia variegata TaxID=167791 RepID=A0ACB9LEX9_BAUVA|nr:hypothetical protein L6164_030986 [Bauhinia variegata]